MQGRDQFVTVKACKGLLKLSFPVEKSKICGDTNQGEGGLRLTHVSRSF